MAQPTVQYKRTLKGSIGAGMKSIAGGDRRFYVLEHKVTTKFHKAGEQQTIIVDQIELGRDPKCQVRFDDSFTTVSRRHAAIVRDGENWKLVQLSQTNSTFLNGKQVTKEWYLQNGDEIQLSVNGPKLGFNVPAGEKGMVKSLRLTTRLNLFREQALRPYKRAMAIMAIVFLGALGAMGAWNYKLQDDLVAQSKRLAEQIAAAKGDAAKLDSLRKELIKANQAIADQESKLKKVRGQITRVKIKPEPGPNNIDKEFPFVYYIECYIHIGDNVIPGWAGTGFLLNNGYLVTAQHVIHYDACSNETEHAINAFYNAGQASIIMVGYSSNDKFQIEYTIDNMPFRLGPVSAKEQIISADDGTTWVVKQRQYNGGGDWAVMPYKRKGGIAF
ncbi:MAG: FHA domain-containing protein, partial [Prevotella sp.]